MNDEVFLTSHEARKDLRYSESGWRYAWMNGNVPAPIIIGGKHLWPKSRIEDFKRDLLQQAAEREAAIKAAGSPEARQAAALGNKAAARHAPGLANSLEARRARSMSTSASRVRQSA